MRRGRRSLLRGLGAFAASAAAAYPAAARLFTVEPRRVESFPLSNGLQVVVLPSSRAPIVSQTVVYKVGSADEVPGKTGIAHFLEHLMFKGTDSVGAGEFSRIVSKNGGRDNAYTSFDSTGYYQTVAPDRLELVMAMESDRMVNLRLDEKEIATEREVVLEERRMRIENSPGALLDEAVHERLFGRNQPYGMPISGYPDDIRGLTLADLRAFYERHYAPDNAVLIVAGDTTADTVAALADKHYGPLPRRAIAARTRPDHGAGDLPQLVTRTDPRVVEPGWARNYLAPSYRRGETRHAYALQVLAGLLGGGETARLWRPLVEEAKIALSVGASYSPASLGLTVFEIGVHPAPGVDFATVEQAVARELGRLLEDGVGAEELERAQNRLLAGAIYAQDSLASGPRQYGSQLAIDVPLAEIEAWPKRIAAVTAGDVVAAARAVWTDKGLVTQQLAPPPAIR